MLDNSLETPNLETVSKPNKSKKSYSEQLKEQMYSLIDRINLSDLQKEFMKSRWLDQLMWLEGRAEKSQKRYYRLRLVTIIGGVIVPALVSLNIDGGNGSNNIQQILGWIAFGLSQAVAISAAVEEFFHYGERYRNYRNTAEAMKIEGWQFFQLSGPYCNAQTHDEVYSDFAQRVENIIRRDVEGYLSEIVQEKTKDDKKQEKETESKT
ncbi:MAG: DUF4231 domain-containing protein [Xenococcus sp. (in: cyanobacteria)]